MEELLKVMGILLLTALAATVTVSYILLCGSVSVIKDQVSQIVKHINTKKLVVAEENEPDKDAK